MGAAGSEALRMETTAVVRYWSMTAGCWRTEDNLRVAGPRETPGGSKSILFDRVGVGGELPSEFGQDQG